MAIGIGSAPGSTRRPQRHVAPPGALSRPSGLHGTAALTRDEKRAVVSSLAAGVSSAQEWPDFHAETAAVLAVSVRTVTDWTKQARLTSDNERDGTIIRLHVVEGMSSRQIAEWLKADGRWPLGHVQVTRVLHDGSSAVVKHRMAERQYDVVVIDPPSCPPGALPREGACNRGRW